MRRLGSYDERGTVTSFVAVVATALVMVAGLAYDGGEIVAAQATARDLAANAARAGAQEVDLDALRSTGVPVVDEARARQAVADYLALTGHPGTARFEGTHVTVTVWVRQPMRLLPLPDRVVTAPDTATATNGDEGQAP